jgi:putative flippase GtrA
MILRFIKFAIVGFSGMVIDFSITILLKEKLKVHRYVASSAGFITAASSNYIMNRIWTFRSTNPEIFREFGTFILISACGLALNNFILYIFEKRAGFYPAKILATGVTILWNFFANYYLTFSLLPLHS